jgi:hypothetical protein
MRMYIQEMIQAMYVQSPSASDYFLVFYLYIRLRPYSFNLDKPKDELDDLELITYTTSGEQ